MVTEEQTSPAYRYAAKLRRVIDGDTIEVEIDLGFRCSCVQRLRLIGVNTAEMHAKDKGERAKALHFKEFVEELIGLPPVEGPRNLIVETQKDDSFGRWLADVYILDQFYPDVHLNEALRKEGAPVYERKKGAKK